MARKHSMHPYLAQQVQELAAEMFTTYYLKHFHKAMAEIEDKIDIVLDKKESLFNISLNVEIGVLAVLKSDLSETLTPHFARKVD